MDKNKKLPCRNKIKNIKVDMPKFIIKNKWFEEQIEKYHLNVISIVHFVNFDCNIMYPNLYKILNSMSDYLSLINGYASSSIYSERCSYDNENLFYMDYESLAMNYAKEKDSIITAISIYCTLGLIKRVPIDEISQDIIELIKKDIKIVNKKIFNSNFYIVYSFFDKFDLADKRAKILLENGFETSFISKEFIGSTLGENIANEVYPVDSNYVSN